MSDSPVCVSTGTAPVAHIIWLHGLGADGHDFEPIVPLLTRGLPPLSFVFPHAPVRPVTINGGMAMRAWYDITGLELAQKEDADGIAESSKIVVDLVAQALQSGFTAQQIFVAGFSQGGAVALHTALSYPARFAGLIALSTYLPLARRLADHRSDANRDLPIYLAHGRQDDVVPLALAQRSQQALVALGYDVELRQFDVAHGVSEPEIADLRAWLSVQLQR